MIKTINTISTIKCLGERYIGCGYSGPDLILEGTPGTLWALISTGRNIFVYGNAQDQTGDTMNEGTIVIHATPATPWAIRCVAAPSIARQRRLSSPAYT